MFVAITFLIGLCGTAALAATAIANQIAAVTFMFPITIGQKSTCQGWQFRPRL